MRPRNLVFLQIAYLLQLLFAQPAKAAPPSVDYVTFEGEALHVYAWPGRSVAIMTARADKDPAVMSRMLAALDRAYAYYAQTTGRIPSGGKLYNGLLVIAEVPSTCGAGCGYIGANGVELQTDFFASFYDQASTSNLYDQGAFLRTWKKLLLLLPPVVEG